MKRPLNFLHTVGPHEYFGRKGSDLTVDLPVTYAEAALGARAGRRTASTVPCPSTPNSPAFSSMGLERIIFVGRQCQTSVLREPLQAAEQQSQREQEL